LSKAPWQATSNQRFAKLSQTTFYDFSELVQRREYSISTRFKNNCQHYLRRTSNNRSYRSLVWIAAPKWRFTGTAALFVAAYVHGFLFFVFATETIDNEQ
jgi:hypothetical protein